ncbi:MAG: HAMP domain-containing protein [Endomicrobiales bacterium]|nr:HAMP domain-containing protein [Endomicrobiales bacterium]
MKLFHKFLIALLVIAIIPLVIYSVILLKTTAITLRSVINQNHFHTAENVAREVNKYFAEVEGKLDLARQMEREKNMSESERIAAILNEMSSSRMLFGILLLDDGYGIVSGMTDEGGTYAVDIDKALVRSAHVSNGVEVGSIFYDVSKAPFVDIVYPLSSKPRQFIYYRFKLNYLVNRIKLGLKNPDESVTKNVLLVDKDGKFAATSELMKALPHELFGKYKEAERDRAFVAEGLVTVVSQSRGPGWLIVVQEPAKVAYAAIIRMQVAGITLILLTMGFALFGAMFLAKNLSKPIEKLLRGMDVVAKGNLDSKVEKVSGDELGKLADIFNDMIEKVKQMQEEVRKNARLSSIGQMANILGHEIRNPLSAMTNSVFLLRRLMAKTKEPEPIMVKSVTIIENEIKSTSRIVDNMLDFSRQRPPVLSEQDYNTVVREIVEGVKMPPNVELELALDGSNKVMIDIEEMKQVIRNLVNNAVDAMGDKENSKLKVGVYKANIVQGDKNISAVSADISDNGCGMSQETIKKIFEPFFSTKSKGTGLGLAVVQKIVEERHNGVIEVKSVVGKGTTFSVKLPLKT